MKVKNQEPTPDVVTWVYEDGSYVPSAKLLNDQRYSIVSDYLGRPVQAYSNRGQLVWQTDYDIYGGLRNLEGEREFIPFRQLGQYEDEETGLYYNRFRYYDSLIGSYISQDPIGIEGNNPTIYAYVIDANNRVDILGLDLHHIIPQAVWRRINNEFDNVLKNIDGYVQNVTKKALDASNLIDLDKPFHGNHPSYSEFVEKHLRNLIDDDNLNLSSVKKLQDELRNLINKAKESGKKLNDYFADDILPKCK